MNHLTIRQLDITNQLALAQERLARVQRDISNPALESDDANDAIHDLDTIIDQLTHTSGDCSQLLDELIHDTTGIEP